MKLINTNQDLIRRLAKNGEEVLHVSLVPYKNNTCIKVYDEEGNPLGDIPEEEISKYIDETRTILFINESIDDDTGLPIFTLGTLV